ncbi:hypothetical protein ADICYQ_2791 [Cyclobacterium qasimii M12-11B]|uniref:Uncharacterized protein n=1 Tax=Cyclobacterium qasimii M12-11B TaxID=641524 RepID=S7VDJ0_9BACT|nr:hypothetical protein ADICYQ_2791 [Cyclobacterium qasimii M12-11B]
MKIEKEEKRDTNEEENTNQLIYWAIVRDSIPFNRRLRK